MRLTKSALHIVASVLILVGLALIVLGLQVTPLLWQVGLGVVALAMAASLATRWAPEPDREAPERGSSAGREDSGPSAQRRR